MEITREAAVRTIENIEITRQVPITSGENLILSHKGFNYYAVDLRDHDHSEIEDIISGCEVVENDTWKAQEDFFDYIKKSDILVYAEKMGQIVGFNLVSLLLVNEYCFYTIDEAMVLRAHQGNNIARNVVSTTLWWFWKKIQVDAAVKKMVLVSISSNPKVVNMYFKNKYITKTLDNSFSPSENLINIHRAYLAKYNFSLVNCEYPFCLKNLFPGSQQHNWNDKRYQFLDEVKKRMPPEFEHTNRGDAWAFMVVTNRWMAYTVIKLLTLAFFGSKAIFNKKIGMFLSKKRLTVTPKLTRIRLIDGRFIERRAVDRRALDRRTDDRRVNDLGHDTAGIDRRIADRRTSERRIEARRSAGR